MFKIIHPYVLSILVLAAGFVVNACTLSAQIMDNPMDRLSLTDAQKAQIKQLKDRFKAETEQLRADIKKLLEEERLLKTSGNEAALRTKMKARADKEIELSLALTRFNKNLDAVLTPEQRKQLERMRTERQNNKPPAE